MMVGVPWRKATKTCMALVMAAVLAVCFALPAFAVTPERPENQYVLDEAGVLSEETEQEIISKNADLFQKTGAQIVVVAVDFLDGEEIGDYANYLFNYWGIGSVERNNGLLLLMTSSTVLLMVKCFSKPSCGVQTRSSEVSTLPEPVPP